MVTGRALQQRSIRSLLRRFEIQTPGNLYAWVRVHQRWTQFSQMLQDFSSPGTPGAVGRQDDKVAQAKTSASAVRSATRVIPPSNRKTPALRSSTGNWDTMDHKVMEVIKTEWNNSTGFLCALGGVLLNKVPSQGSEAEVTESDGLLDAFIKNLLDLLVSNDLFMREAIMNVLGTSLSAAVFPMLFTALNTILQSHIGKKSLGLASLFIDQAISVVRQILEQPHQSSDDLAMADFEVLITPCVQYASQLVSSASSLRIKAKLCQLVETLMSRRESISFRHEISFRNNLVELMIEWMSDFSDKDKELKELSSNEPTAMSTPVVDLQKLRMDVDTSCMKALIQLLHNLPLQPSDAMASDADAGSTDVDTGKAKSRLFLKYFTFFSRLLQRCRERPEDSPRDLAGLTINALSNLLNANIDAGLEHIVTMGYHDSHETRATVLKVITNVLQQGTEFEALSESFAQDRYEKLLDLIMEPDMSIAVALAGCAQPTDADIIASLLIHVFYGNGKALNLLDAVVDYEVASTESEGTLFRGNSMSTKMLISYARATLSGAIDDFVKADISVELDPLRMASGDDSEANLKALVSYSELFFNAILKSGDSAPRDFRMICKHLYDTVGKRFPAAKRKSVGGFLFLRFFCPAIVAPDTYNMIEGSASDRSRRGLIIMAKILQNLANEVQFGGLKEEYMVPCNKFLASHAEPLAAFFDKMATTGDEASHEMAEEELWSLHRLLENYKEKLANSMCFDNTGPVQDVRRKTFERLTTLLAQLGSPPEPSKTSSANDDDIGSAPMVRSFEAANVHFEEFMTRNASRDIKSIKERDIFYESGVSRLGRPVLYYIARRIDSAKLDMDLVLYYILKTSQPHFGRSFEIVIDLTLFSEEHEIHKAWCLKFLKLIPHDADTHCAAIRLFNASSWFKKYAKQRLNKLVTSKASKRLSFATGLADLKEFIPDCEKGLPQSTLALISDFKVTFSPVLKVSQYGQKEVIVKMGTNVMQIYTVKPHNILNKDTTLVDFYHIGRIEDVKMRDESTGEFIITYEWHGEKTLCLRTSQADQLVQTIKQAKARYLLTKPAQVSKRVFRPSDVPGTLINMGLLNLASSYGELRQAAYNLVQACAETFNFDLYEIVLPAKGQGVPKNVSRVILTLSETLSKTAPHLTLELLGEALHGFKKSSSQLKHITLQYITPWLKNLDSYVPEIDQKHWVRHLEMRVVDSHGQVVPLDGDAKEKVEKVEMILLELFQLTLVEPRLFHAFLNHVWRPASMHPRLAPVCLGILIRKSLTSGFMSGYAETAADVAVTLSNKESPAGLATMVMARLKHLVEDCVLIYLKPEDRISNKPLPITYAGTADDEPNTTNDNDDKATEGYVNIEALSTSYSSTAEPVPSPDAPKLFDLYESAQWQEVSVLMRFVLALTFDDLLNVEKNMPELLHVVLLLFHCGNSIMRTTVYSILINVIQSVCLLDKDRGSGHVRLKFLLNDLSQPKWLLLFGVAGIQPYAQFTSSELQRLLSKHLERCAITNAAPVAEMMSDVLRLSQEIVGESVATQWRERWISLIKSSSFNKNRRLLQSRSLIQLGALIDGEGRVTDALLGEMLTLLSEVLSDAVTFGPNDPKQLDLPIGIIICLSQIVKFIPATSSYLSGMFWVAMSVIQVSLFQAALVLLENVLKTYEERGLSVDDSSLHVYCMWARKHMIETAATRMDQLTQMHFGTSFSFAVVGNLLKGLKHPQTKSATMNVLSRFLHIGTKETEFGPESLAYAAALMHTEARHGSILLKNMSDRSREHLYTRQTAALLLTLFTTILTKAEYETDQLFMYSLLRVAIVTIPDVFPVIHDGLMPKISQILNTSHNTEIVAAVQSILYTMVSAKEKLRHAMQNALTPGLPVAGSFSDISAQRRSNISQCAAQLLSNLVERVQVHAKQDRPSSVIIPPSGMMNVSSPVPVDDVKVVQSVVIASGSPSPAPQIETNTVQQPVIVQPLREQPVAELTVQKPVEMKPVLENAEEPFVITDSAPPSQ